MSTRQQNSVKTPFGDRHGVIVAPADVASGLACDCVCPGCGEALIAKKEDSVVWHFAHHTSVGTSSCAESAIHAAAKSVLLAANWLHVPEKWIEVSARTDARALHVKTSQLAPSKAIRFDYCQEEVWETNLRPDVVGYRGTRRLLVEMFFTHRVDDIKRTKLANLQVPAIEIDLSSLPVDVGFDEVVQKVVHGITDKEWLFYPGEADARIALQSSLAEEIAQLNLADRTRLEAQGREQERRANAQAKREAAYEERKIRDAATTARIEIEVAAENAEYQRIPLAEKERLLRKVLGIQGTWPYYLNKATSQASPFNEPLRVWQGGLFAHFIFNKQVGSARIYLDNASDWAIARFGITPNRNGLAKTAVKQYLGYLRACGFLKKSPYNPYEADYFEVAHPALTPPSTFNHSNVGLQKAAPKVFEGTVNVPEVKPHWSWRASWPDQVEMVDAAKLLLASSPHSSEIVNALEALTPRARPNEPLVSALLLETKGVPRDITLPLLVQLGLALKTSRTV